MPKPGAKHAEEIRLDRDVDVGRLVERAEKLAWLAAHDADTGDEEFVGAEVAGAVRHQLRRAVRQGADAKQLRQLADSTYDAALSEAMEERDVEASTHSPGPSGDTAE